MLLTTVLTIYTSIGFGVWLGLVAFRIKYNKSNYFRYGDLKSFLLGFFGSLIAWPILIFYIEV